MRGRKVELTEYQKYFLWCKDHNITISSKNSKSRGRLIVVENKSRYGEGKTIADAIKDYEGK